MQRLRDAAPLLDAPDAAFELMTLDGRLREAETAARELTRTAAARGVLERRLDDLREVPLDDTALAALDAELEAANRERARLFRAHTELQTVDRNREALAWTDAEEILARKQELAPILKAELDKAKAWLDQASAARGRAEASEQAVDAKARSALGDWESKRRELADNEGALAACEVVDPSEAAVVAAQTEVDRQEELLRQTRRELGERQTAAGRLDGEESEAAKETHLKAELLRQKEAIARPAQERWDALELKAREAMVYDEALLEAPSLPVGNAIHLWQARTQPRVELLERLRRLKDGSEMEARLAERLSPTGDEPQGAAYLEAWLELRAWLALRVPAQISEGEDPVRALQALGERLQHLADGLAEQERRLRGEASSVAASIKSASQKAATTVRKLNTDLRDVAFGSITSVRLVCESRREMVNVLNALGGDAGQSMLFDSGLPFEEALDKLFEQHGGGRSGGQRLLDFREYLDLRVEVTRRASQTWEAANPTRMSTGEAIGVGAAVMIVVLGAWERDAQFLRGKKTSASLRFLFLDEASRLDRDTLGNLFELCSRLGLQLLIAAPEVARAESNTTYRLVRKVGSDGRDTVEVVEVSGRRRRTDAVA